MTSGLAGMEESFTKKELIGIVKRMLVRYIELEDHFRQFGDYVIEHRGISFSFLDLQGCLKDLPTRKKEAVYYNVILDMQQKDAAEIMGITSVSVGQYVSSVCLQIAEQLWGEDL